MSLTERMQLIYWNSVGASASRHQHGSTIGDGVKMFYVDHLLFLLVFMFFLVNPLAATLCFPCELLSTGPRCLVSWSMCQWDRTVAPAPDSPYGAVRQCTIGTSPLSDAVMDSRGCAFPSSPITVSARTCQRLASPTWSWILQTRQ